MKKLQQATFACLAGVGMMAGTALAQAPAPAPAATQDPVAKDLVFNNRKGNCLACHGMPTVPDAVATGLYGPPLIAMSARYPDKAKLRAQIWNAMAANPATTMPPFGKHGVLTEAEIDKVTDFIYGL
jgi:sulfur-oxidizing protein SoxX